MNTKVKNLYSGKPDARDELSTPNSPFFLFSIRDLLVFLTFTYIVGILPYAFLTAITLKRAKNSSLPFFAY